MERNNNERNIEQMKRRARSKKKRRKNDLSIKKARNIAGSIIVLLELILSVVFIGYIDKLNVMPMKYFSIVFAVLMAFFMAVFLTQLSKKTHIFGKLLGVIMCAVLVVGIVYMSKTVKTLNELGQAGKYAENEFFVTVLKDSKITETKELDGKNIGIMKISDTAIRDKALDEIKKKTGSELNTKEYDTAAELIDALYDGKVDAAVYRSSYESIIIEARENFSSETRHIDTITVKTEIVNDSKFELDPKGITTHPFIVLLSGTDAEGKVSSVGRSDTNILAVINPATQKVLLVVTPRDSYLPIPGMTPEGEFDKLTHSGNEGVEVTMATLEKLYGIDIDYFAKFNFESFTGVIDILGGINVYSEVEFTSSGGFYFNQGYNEIKEGIVALQFARERHAFPDGDFQRGRNQMAIVKAVIDKALSPSIITSYFDIMDAASSIVHTNFPPECVTELVKYQLNENCKWNIETVSVTGDGSVYEYCYSWKESKLNVVVLDDDSVETAKQAINDVINGK